MKGLMFMKKNKTSLLMLFVIHFTLMGVSKNKDLTKNAECVAMEKRINIESNDGLALEGRIKELTKQLEGNQKYLAEITTACQKKNNCQQMAVQIGMVQNQTTLLQGEKLGLAEKQMANFKTIEVLRAQMKSKCHDSEISKLSK
ncbi:MAG: hypothetical protein RJB66_1426 [Pseudomonadota bacterium]|jgi:hypothetical protein